MSKEFLKTKIGLEIHVQLATKSKMFCGCDNNAEGKEPNSMVCPVCMGLPGSLPVANKQAVLFTLKTGIVLNCKISKISKFDRKHYFYPDLPKGYQISQYDEPFCVGGYVDVTDGRINLTRIHLEEDAGKLTHSNGSSLVDLNRAGTPLMEIVSDPDITSPKQAGEFLRKLQKIVRDVARVSEASMEKGHLRCDANISVSDDKGVMSQIVELKNINSFRFVEKALEIEEARLKDEYPNWPEDGKKVTRGYDSKKNTTFVQRTKEEAADYRYFPEPDLPPFDTSCFDLESLRQDIGSSEEDVIAELLKIGITETDSVVLANDLNKLLFFRKISDFYEDNAYVARAVVHNYLGFSIVEDDYVLSAEYAQGLKKLKEGAITKSLLAEIAVLIHDKKCTYQAALEMKGGGVVNDEAELGSMIDLILEKFPAEVLSYKSGKTQLLGFFMGQVMREAKGKADPKAVNRMVLDKLK